MPQAALIDSHCHLDFPEFDHDRSEILTQLRKLNFQAVIVPGASPEQWSRVRALSQTEREVYYACGFHPWWLSSNNQRSKNLEAASEYLADAKCVAVGETGLDANIDYPMEQQILSLEEHFELSEAHQLPIILHCVKAHNSLIKLLKNNRYKSGGVIHAFSGSFELAKNYWDMGMYLGVGGTITYERAIKTRNALQKMPLEALILETDAPAMPLAGEQGQRNSPTNLVKIAHCLAEIKQCSPEEIIAACAENTQKLFLKLNQHLSSYAH